MAVKGVDILVLVEDPQASGTFLEAGGQRGATLNETNETFETTHKGSNGYREYEYSFGTWKVSADGLYITGDAGYEALVNALRNKLKVVVRWTEKGVQTFEGTALITSRDLEGPYDAEATYSVELLGSGAPVLV